MQYLQHLFCSAGFFKPAEAEEQTAACERCLAKKISPALM